MFPSIFLQFVLFQSDGSIEHKLNFTNVDRSTDSSRVGFLRRNTPAGRCLDTQKSNY